MKNLLFDLYKYSVHPSLLSIQNVYRLTCSVSHRLALNFVITECLNVGLSVIMTLQRQAGTHVLDIESLTMPPPPTDKLLPAQWPLWHLPWHRKVALVALCAVAQPVTDQFVAGVLPQPLCSWQSLATRYRSVPAMGSYGCSLNLTFTLLTPVAAAAAVTRNYNRHCAGGAADVGRWNVHTNTQTYSQYTALESKTHNWVLIKQNGNFKANFFWSFSLSLFLLFFNLLLSLSFSFSLSIYLSITYFSVGWTIASWNGIKTLMVSVGRLTQTFEYCSNTHTLSFNSNCHCLCLCVCF